MLYNLLLPLRLDWLPLYSSETELRIGQRVEVRFSGNDYTAVVVGAGRQTAATAYKVNTISALLPQVPDITAEELKLWRFISSYYLCTLGEVYAAAYPKYKTESEKKHRKTDPDTPVCCDLTPKPESLRAGKPILYEGSDRNGYYMEKIRVCLDAGFSALVLVPELEYTFILQQAISGRFPGQVFLYDSLITPAKKRKLAQTLRKADKPVVVIGTKSALFLPYRKLGVVIVDEEQDSSHKQPEPAPRYNARDTAIVLGSIHSAQVVLGSFTPSLESLYNCKTGKYTLVQGQLSPSCKLDVIDILAEKKKKGMEGDYSKKLLIKLKRTDCKEKVCIIRSYKSEEETAEFFATRFPGLDPQILTAFSAKHNTADTALTAVLNADSLFDRDDFRSDEKALQLLRSFASHTQNLVIQCTASSLPVYSAIGDISFEDELLKERKTFRMPPYTRMVDIKDKKTGQLVERKTLDRDAHLDEAKARLKVQYGALYIIDVDPI